MAHRTLHEIAIWNVKQRKINFEAHVYRDRPNTYAILVPGVLFRHEKQPWTSFRRRLQARSGFTKLGRALNDALVALEGVTLVIDSEERYAFTIHVNRRQTGESLHWLSHGLPETVQVTIEEAVLRASSRFERCLMALRAHLI